jgi:hypothetical protein
MGELVLHPAHKDFILPNWICGANRKVTLILIRLWPAKGGLAGSRVIGDYNVDLFVDNRLIIELKAAKALADEHAAQILGYLRASRLEHGLLINFGAPRFEIKKYALSQPGQGGGAPGLTAMLLSTDG